MMPLELSQAFFSQPLFTISSFIFGTCMAGFLCLAVYRLPHQLAWVENPRRDLTLWSPPSFCEHCEKSIEKIFLTPILGWCFTRGRCSFCKKSISPFYPLWELAMGLLCALLAYAFGPGWAAITSIGLALTLFFLAWMDWKETWLPEVVTLPLFWTGLLFSPVAEPQARIIGAFLGFFLMAGAMLWVSHRRGENILAGGDIMLSTAAGAWLGTWYTELFIILSSLFFIPLYFLNKSVRKTESGEENFAPAGPALALSFFICYILQLFGSNLVDSLT